MGIQKEDLYLRETLAVEYRVRAIRCLGETLQNSLSVELDDNERDGIFATIQVLLLQDVSCNSHHFVDDTKSDFMTRSLNPASLPMVPISQVLCLFATSCVCLALWIRPMSGQYSSWAIWHGKLLLFAFFQDQSSEHAIGWTLSDHLQIHSDYASLLNSESLLPHLET